MMQQYRSTALVAAALYTSSLLLPVRAVTPSTIIPTTCFDSQQDFDTYFSYNYPWGDTHNGAAKMRSSQCSLSNGALIETSEYSPNMGTATSGGQTITLNYWSCTVYAKPTFTVAQGGGYDFSAQFQAPTELGTWPAFWLTATSGWPPEIDIAEWKGDGKISFNTFNTSSAVTADNVPYPSDGAWHSVKAEIRDENGSDVSIAFYLDGAYQTTQYAPDYVGKGLELIIDYQMEGSSGSPGPQTTTTYSISNVEVLDYNP